MASSVMYCIPILIFGFVSDTFVLAQITTLTNVDDEFSNIFDSYYDKQSIVPVQTVGTIMAVTVDFELVSVVGFDDDTGSATINGYLTVKWTEERYTTVADDIDVSIPASSIWTPPLLIVNSLSSAASIDSDDDILKLNLNTAQVVWKPRIYTKVKCDSNAFYPFDKQGCSILISSRTLDNTEMTITVSQTNIGTTQYIKSGLWELKESSAKSYSVKLYSYASFHLTIQRKSQYVTLIILCPVILMSMVHLFVFLLPPDSEKLNYSITSMLGFTLVALWIITYVPLNTEPVSIIVYYIFTEFLLNVVVLMFALNIFKEISDCGSTSCFESLVPKQNSKLTSRKNGVIGPESRQESAAAREGHVSSVNTAWDDVEEDSQVTDTSSEKNTHKSQSSNEILSPKSMFILFLCLHVLFTIAFFVSLGINLE